MVPQGWIGVHTWPLTQEIADRLGLKSTKGALVAEAWPNFPASAAGIKSGDVILSIDGERIDGPPDVTRKVLALGPGKKVDVIFWRDGSEKTVSVTLGSHLPGDVIRLVETFPDGRRYDGEFRDEQVERPRCPHFREWRTL
ncbi:MAG: PDZ domain-containing protein [Methylocella sp.]